MNVNPIHTGGGGGGGGTVSAPPLTFFSITFEIFIVTPSNFVTFPNFYLSLLWDKKFLENMPHFLSVSTFFFKMIFYDKFYYLCIAKKKKNLVEK